jgi:hypothetical protein
MNYKETTNHVNHRDNYIMPRGSATEAVNRNIVNLNPSLILHHFELLVNKLFA